MKIEGDIQNFISALRNPRSALILFIGMSLSVFSFILFIEIAEEVLEKEKIVHFDTAVSNFIYSFRTPALTKTMIGITSLGESLILGAVAALIIALAYKIHKKKALWFSLVLGIGVVLNWFLKLVIQRQRPVIAPILHLDSYSFPSGHAMNSMVFYSLLAYCISRLISERVNTILIFLFTITLIFLIGLSRVYLGVHYPSDVIAGFVAGFWVFITAIWIEHSITFYKLKPWKGNRNESSA